MSDLLWPIFKLFLFLTLTLCIYLLHKMILKPFLFRKKYSKYANVYVDPTFRPLVGDNFYYVDDVAHDRVFYDHAREQAEVLADYDMKVTVEGMFAGLKLVSPKAVKEFTQLQPKSIDRQPDLRGIGKIMLDAFVNSRSGSEFQKNRKMYLQLLSLNSASCYIPMMLENTQKMVDSWPTDEQFDLGESFTELTFQIFTTILFGKDIKDLGKIPYIHPDGTIEEMGFRQSFHKLASDYVAVYYSVSACVFPFFNDFHLIEPYKRNLKNLTAFKAHLVHFLSLSKDPNSIHKKGLSILDDLILLMLAGSDTSSHTLTSIIYYLYKSPHTSQQKLREEIEQKVGRQVTKENVQSVDYLNYVVKEALRLDNPAGNTFGYETYEDVTICDVPIPRGTLLRLDIFGAHLNPKEWQRPKEFIPERFDPESELYHKPGEDKARSPYSWMAFSQGVRTCPGQSIALLQIKVILAFLLTRYTFEVDKEILEKEGVGFGVGSHFKLMVKAKKIE